MNEDSLTKLNWVERRAQREALLSSQSPELWTQVRAALQDACESFNKNYDKKVTCKPENGTSLRLVHVLRADRITSSQDSSFEVLVEFDPKTPAIKATYQAGTTKTFAISADQESVFPLDGKERKTIDQLSERILEIILFPPQQPPPRVQHYGGPSGPRGWMA